MPRVDFAERLARAAGVDPCWLCFGHYGARPFQDKIPRAEQVVGLPPQLPPAPEDAGLACRGFGVRLVSARKAAGLSRAALGRAADIAHSAIGYAEEGRTLPYIDSIEALALALGCSACWLAFGEGEGPAGSTVERSTR